MLGWLCDAHAHLGSEEELRARVEAVIPTMLCGTDPENAKAVQNACEKQPLFWPTYGLHPWKTGQYSVRQMDAWLEKCGAVGEIGMDSVWCDVPAHVQREAFVRQLDAARDMGKPVVLHTKGCELEIARILKHYSLKAVVHWYSCTEHLERYLDMDCVFTLGPDLQTNPAVQAVARRAPLDRLLLETDGLNAVEWALNRKTTPDDLPAILEGMLTALAGIKAVSLKEARSAILRNFNRLKGEN